MTREEAITVLKGLSDNPLFGDQHRAAFKIAIHDIKANHNWALNNLILINKDNYEPLDQEPIWISVNERLPEESHAVLVYCPERKNTYCAFYVNKQWWIFGAFMEKLYEEVRAWMPLPEPPKAESEET